MATSEDIQYHYDVDTDFYSAFLDRHYLTYSCGIWDDACDLESAQVAKLARIGHFANIEPGYRVLDVGCGWGGMMKYATETMGAEQAVGLTLSRDQYAYVSGIGERRIEVRLLSWGEFQTSVPFDAIVSIGAFEHFASVEDSCARRQIDIYRRFFKACALWSTAQARLALQTIVVKRRPNTLQGVRDARYLLERVFPGSALPYVSDIQAAISGLYEISEMRSIGSHYARTLAEWNRRLRSDKDRIVKRYGEDIYAHYDRYFNAAKSGFENGFTDLVQVSLRKTEDSWNYRNDTLHMDIEERNNG